METFASTALVVMVIVTTVVGARLLLVARRTRALPELLFGLGFLGGGIGQAFGTLGTQLIWNTPGALATTLNTACFFLVIVSTACLYAAIWRVFPISGRRGPVMFLLGVSAAVVGFGMRIHSGDFSSGAIDSWGNRVFTNSLISVFSWGALEAFAYYRLLRKRIRLGLASLLEANQIFLWGLAAVSGASLTIVIGHNTMTLLRSPLEDPVSMSLIMLFVMLGSGCMWCSFFPPSALRRRLEAGARA